MKFRIRRTSGWHDEEQPVSEAEWVEVPAKTYDGRDTTCELWQIELDSLEELLELVDAEGQIVVSEMDLNIDDPAYEIEIYDSHRE